MIRILTRVQILPPALLEVRARVLLRCPWRLFSTQEFNETLPMTNIEIKSQRKTWSFAIA